MIYERHCKNCKKRTIQKVCKISRLKGIKLQCSNCGNIPLKYFRLNSKSLKGGMEDSKENVKLKNLFKLK